MQPPSHPSPRPTPRPHPNPAPPPGTLQTGLTPKQLLARFRTLLPARLLSVWQQAPRCFYERAFTLPITLWYFVFQRLQSDHTLSRVLADALAGGADELSPKGKRLSAQLRSEATTALSDARQRLPLPVLSAALQHCAQEVRSWSQGLLWHGWNVVLLDGSTLRMRPHAKIAPEFPPHGSGQGHQSYWCLMRVVVAFCLTSGVVLGSAMGPLRLSEQALAAQWFSVGSLLQSVVVGDRNFGVYFVARAAWAASAQVVLRLTEARARKLARAARVGWRAGLDAPVAWSPSPHDHCPEGLEPLDVAGRLLALRVQRPGFRPQTLYLFTTLTDPQAYPPAELAWLYGQRWQVELNLRFVKTQLELGVLECKSADMARKEWLAGLIAYNLIRSVMLAAAALSQIQVSILSFSRARQFLHDWLVRSAGRAAASVQLWTQLLAWIARCRHPRRRKSRPSKPRAVREFKSPFPKLKGDRAAARQNLKITNAKS